MNQRDIQLKADVMRRVWAVYHMRRISDSFLFKSGFLAATAAMLVFMVSVPHVIMNIYSLQSTMQYEPFLWHAFWHTSLAVQGLIVLLVTSSILVVRDIFRNIRNRGWSLNFRAA